MSGPDVVRLEVNGPVALLTMTAGENRHNDRWLVAMNAALDRVEAAGDVVLVTTGQNKFFSNGLDLEWLVSGDADADRFFAGLHALLGRILTFPIATAAAINGHAFGAGLQLALAHDIRVMREDKGWACMPEVDLGAPLQPGMNALMRATVPRAALRELMTTGRRFTGPESVAAGFVHQTADADHLVAAAGAKIEHLAGRDRSALHQIKVDLFREWLPTLDPARWPRG